MIASHIGFGAIAQAAGLSVLAAVSTTVFIWALPGQLVFVESWTQGASYLATIPAVMLTATRFLPMTVSLMPMMRHPRHSEPIYYVAAHLLSMMSWAVVTPRCPDIPHEERLAYFFGFALACWFVSMSAVALGFYLAGEIPRQIQFALVMLTPITFLLMLTGDTRHRAGRIALAFGAVAGPILHKVNPQWDLLATGLIAGTAAFAVDRRMRSMAQR
jgi:predicted branched-subunit amino acid permease